MSPVTEIATRLMRDGVVDNVPDAVLAAIRILAVADSLAEPPGDEKMAPVATVA